MKEMKFLLAASFVFILLAASANSNPTFPFYLGSEPLIRIGLSTNSSSVSIATGGPAVKPPAR